MLNENRFLGTFRGHNTQTKCRTVDNIIKYTGKHKFYSLMFIDSFNIYTKRN